MTRSRSLRVLAACGLIAATAYAAKVEAESYSLAAGVATEGCSEGGLNVGWIDAGDWMVYPINIASTGSYTISYRVASPNSGKSLSSDLNAGSIQLGAVAIPNTGSWQGWTTVTQTVTLNAGNYNFGINGGTGGFNVNWFSIDAAGGTTPTPTVWEPLDSFNSSLWQMADWTNGGMFNCGWKPDHISFSGGVMTLKLDNVSSHGKPYTSGEYRSVKTYGYGTFETNMKAAKGVGTVTSFFTYTGNPWDEIDVEILGKNTWQVQFNYFVSGVGYHEKVVDLGFDASAGYHKYTIEWGNGYINWYVDGVWKHGVSGGSQPTHPMQVMVNLWPGIGVDGWLGAFTYPGPLYANYDYIMYTPK